MKHTDKVVLLWLSLDLLSCFKMWCCVYLHSQWIQCQITDWGVMWSPALPVTTLPPLSSRWKCSLLEHMPSSADWCSRSLNPKVTCSNCPKIYQLRPCGCCCFQLKSGFQYFGIEKCWNPDRCAFAFWTLVLEFRFTLKQNSKIPI